MLSNTLTLFHTEYTRSMQLQNLNAKRLHHTPLTNSSRLDKFKKNRKIWFFCFFFYNTHTILNVHQQSFTRIHRHPTRIVPHQLNTHKINHSIINVGQLDGFFFSLLLSPDAISSFRLLSIVFCGSPHFHFISSLVYGNYNNKFTLFIYCMWMIEFNIFFFVVVFTLCCVRWMTAL